MGQCNGCPREGPEGTEAQRSQICAHEKGARKRTEAGHRNSPKSISSTHKASWEGSPAPEATGEVESNQIEVVCDTYTLSRLTLNILNLLQNIKKMQIIAITALHRAVANGHSHT